MSVLTIWTVYDRPTDFPDCFVARRFDVGPSGAVATGDLMVAADLDAIHSQLPPGLVRMDRAPSDDPHIIESWL